MRRRPGAMLMVGAVVGAAAAKNQEEQRKRAIAEQRHKEEELARANAEAKAAKNNAYGNGNEAVPLVYAAPVASPPQMEQQPVVIVQEKSEMGRHMLQDALSGPEEKSEDELIFLQKQLKVTQIMCVSRVIGSFSKQTRILI